jgi:hypothetical protein
MHQDTQRLLARPALKAPSPNGALAVSRTARRVESADARRLRSPQVLHGVSDSYHKCIIYQSQVNFSMLLDLSLHPPPPSDFQHRLPE